MDFTITETLSRIFAYLKDLLNDTYVVYGLTLLFYYLIFYSIFSSVIKRLKFFEGEGGSGLSKPGKTLAHAFTGLAVLSIFAFVDPARNNVFSLLAIFGVYGQLLLVIVIYFLTKRLLVDDGR
ncbi:MAG: hypothetical protein ACQEP1_00865 [Nanobdellota archaeon]